MENMIENVNSYSMESLQWLIDAGADEAIGEFAVDRFESSAKAQAIPHSNQPQSGNNHTEYVKTATAISVKTAPNQESLGTNQAITKAKEICMNASSISDITKSLKDFDGCPSLKNTATNTVVYRGGENPTILCIGNIPNRDDDKNGTPFSNKNELLLKRMFTAIGHDMDSIGFTNTVFWCPPGGRSIAKSELDICRIFLDKLIEISQPKILVLFGGEVCRSLLSTTGGIGKSHGKIQSLSLPNEKSIDCIALHHPDYILQTPMCKPVVWQDLKKLRQYLISSIS